MAATITYGRLNPTIVHLSDEQEARERVFMDTFVSKYFLPKKIRQARARGSVKLAVPVETLDRLVARIELAKSKGQGSIQVGVDNLAGWLAEAGVES